MTVYGHLKLDIGGSGGGSVQLQAPRVTVEGTVACNGNDAFNGNDADWSGDGGSGGSIFIDCNVLELGEQSRLSAVGGNGGNLNSVRGRKGSDGQIVLMAQTQIKLNSEPAEPSAVYL